MLSIFVNSGIYFYIKAEERPGAVLAPVIAVIFAYFALSLNFRIYRMYCLPSDRSI